MQGYLFSFFLQGLGWLQYLGFRLRSWAFLDRVGFGFRVLDSSCFLVACPNDGLVENR